MNDLVARLRSYLPLGDGSLWSQSSKDIAKAADAIEALQADIEAAYKQGMDVSMNNIIDMRREIAARDLVIKRMRDKFDLYLEATDTTEFGCACDPSVGYTCGTCRAYERQKPLRDAVSIQPSTSALDAYVSKEMAGMIESLPIDPAFKNRIATMIRHKQEGK